MAQSSAPISQGTSAERQFTDSQWRDRFGDEPGVLSDMDGTSYALTVSGADTFSVGSATQASLATVAGFVHRVPAGSPEPVTIPAAVGATRTDVIALRYDPTFTGAPGPVRLTVITGSSSAIPTYDSSPPGVEDLPLFAVTRVAGQTLAQATIVRMYPRLAPTIGVPVGAVLPPSSPLDTVAWQGNTQYRRLLSGSTPTWTSNQATTVVPWVNLSYASGYAAATGQARAQVRLLDGGRVEFRGTVARTSGDVVNGATVATLTAPYRPLAARKFVAPDANSGGDGIVLLIFNTSGTVVSQRFQGSNMANPPSMFGLDGIFYDVSS